MKNIKTSDSELNYQRKIQRLQRVGAVVAGLALLAVFLYFYIKYGKRLYNIFSDAERLRSFLAQFQGFDRWVFVAIRAFQTVIKIIPAEPLEIGSGMLYGKWGGMFLCILGTEIGSLIIIALTKVFGRTLVGAFIPMEKIESLKFLHDEKKVYFVLFFIYLIPGTPKDVLTYAAALTKLDMRVFLLVTSVARIPSIISSTWCGEELINQNYTIAIIVFAATAVLSLVCSLIYKKLSSSKESENTEKISEEGENP